MAEIAGLRMIPFMNSSIKWAAKIDGVREVSLSCDADHGYWSRLLEPLGVVPSCFDGKARVVIIAASARFKGMPFRELSFSVQVDRFRDRNFEQAVYLLGAINSSRFFAWVERTAFSTPYSSGNVEVETTPDPLIRAVGTRTAFIAKMSSGKTLEASLANNWQGPVLFSRPGTGLVGHFFQAEISGEILSRDFDPSVDQFQIFAPGPGSFLDHLNQSEIRPTTWLIRRSAKHAKSKTYPVSLIE